MHMCYQFCPNWKLNAFMVDDALAEIIALRSPQSSYLTFQLVFNINISHLKWIKYGRKINRCGVIFCVWHVRRAWLKNFKRFSSTIEKGKEMFNDLGHIMKNCLNNEMTTTINGFFTKFAAEVNFLDYFHKNWIVSYKFSKFTYSFLCL